MSFVFIVRTGLVATILTSQCVPYCYETMDEQKQTVQHTVDELIRMSPVECLHSARLIEGLA